MKPNLSALRRVIESAGGTLEEDEGRRDLRRFQACAPTGKVWKANDSLHIVIDWARGSSAQIERFNKDALKWAAASLGHGLRDQTEEEQFLFSED